MPTTGASRFWMVAGPEFKMVVEALASVDASMPHEFKKELDKAIEPRVRKAQANVTSLPIRGSSSRSTGLRKRVAAGVHVRSSVGTDPYFRVETSMPDPSEAIIPRGLDRTSGWRHPVFGNRNVWVRQLPLRTGWFTDPFQNAEGDMERSLTNVLENASQKVAAAGGSAKPGI